MKEKSSRKAQLVTCINIAKQLRDFAKTIGPDDTGDVFAYFFYIADQVYNKKTLLNSGKNTK